MATAKVLFSNLYLDQEDHEDQKENLAHIAEQTMPIYLDVWLILKNNLNNALADLASFGRRFSK